MNVYSRKLIGYALADHMRVSLVIEALSHARKVRGSLDWAIFHSDHGSVYTSQAFGTTAPSLVCANLWKQWERVRITP
ncbi:DDE-type integrase/transposase/recombinase [Corynebacterium belfantii]|nr:DDE-type integrase/transposase/recombinase [Corynebacterium belfantii]